LLIVSTKKKKRIPYHDKVIAKFHKNLSALDSFILTCNPILSGSLAVNFLYNPEISSGDVDIYFATAEDYVKCFEHFKTKDAVYYQTENAITLPTYNLQLISKEFLPPEELIYTHDFVNVSVAITVDTIYTTRETHLSWYNQELVLRNFQISENPTDAERVVALFHLANRISKYIARYDLPLSNSFKKFFYQQLEFLNQINPEVFKITQQESIDYYGITVTHSSDIARIKSTITDLLEVNSHQDSLDWRPF
jgi:hypothetical protein